MSRPVARARTGTFPRLAALLAVLGAAPNFALHAAEPTRLPIAERTGNLRLSGANSMGMQLLPALLADYGLEAGLSSAQEEVATDPAERRLQFQGAESSRRLRARIIARGSASAFADLLKGEADIGMSTRRPTEAETRALQTAGLVLPRNLENEAVIGLTGVAIVVHPSNPLRTLSMQQARDLLSGANTRWSSVGGANLPVTVHGLDRDTGAHDMVQDRLLGPTARISPRARLYGSHEDLAEALATDPGGIGFVGTAYTQNVRTLRLAQDCGLGGDPAGFFLKTEEYPLASRLYLYTTTRGTKLARDVLAHATSARAQAVVGQAGFTNLDPILASAEESAAQLAAAGAFLPAELRDIARPQIEALRKTMADARRFSVTFRFEAGRADMDARAEADMERLAQWARQPANAQARFVLVGHASIDGAYAANLALSRQRAEGIAARLRQLGLNVAQVEAAGPVNQVVCNRSANDSDMNRRVEVWVR